MEAWFSQQAGLNSCIDWWKPKQNVRADTQFSEVGRTADIKSGQSRFKLQLCQPWLHSSRHISSSLTSVFYSGKWVPEPVGYVKWNVSGLGSPSVNLSPSFLTSGGPLLTPLHAGYVALPASSPCFSLSSPYIITGHVSHIYLLLSSCQTQPQNVSTMQVWRTSVYKHLEPCLVLSRSTETLAQ